MVICTLYFHHPKLIDSFPIIKERTLDWVLSNSWPVGFIAFAALNGFPLKKNKLALLLIVIHYIDCIL